MKKETTIDILVLKTSLFGNAKDLLNTIESIEGIKTDIIELEPAQMGDADWDNVIQCSLQAKKVVTL